MVIDDGVFFGRSELEIRERMLRYRRVIEDIDGLDIHPKKWHLPVCAGLDVFGMWLCDRYPCTLRKCGT